MLPPPGSRHPESRSAHSSSPSTRRPFAARCSGTPTRPGTSRGYSASTRTNSSSSTSLSPRLTRLTRSTMPSPTCSKAATCAVSSCTNTEPYRSGRSRRYDPSDKQMAPGGRAEAPGAVAVGLQSSRTIGLDGQSPEPCRVAPTVGLRTTFGAALASSHLSIRRCPSPVAQWGSSWRSNRGPGRRTVAHRSGATGSPRPSGSTGAISAGRGPGSLRGPASARLPHPDADDSSASS